MNAEEFGMFFCGLFIGFLAMGVVYKFSTPLSQDCQNLCGTDVVLTCEWGKNPLNNDALLITTCASLDEDKRLKIRVQQK